MACTGSMLDYWQKVNVQFIACVSLEISLACVWIFEKQQTIYE